MKKSRKIVFINPPLTAEQRYGEFSAGNSLQKNKDSDLERLADSLWIEPPLGLTYLAAVTRKMGIETYLIDMPAINMEKEGVVDFIEKNDIDFVGITFTTVSVSIASDIASLIKERFSNVKVIAGGCHLTSLPQKTMFENAGFDIGIVGEGEETIEELLNKMIDEEDVSSVNGIAFREGDQIISTPHRNRIQNLDELPFPAFDLLPDIKTHYRVALQSIKYFPTTSLITSRGCSGKCVFCDRTTFGNRIRTHSAEYIVDMMERLNKDFGIKGVLFEDDNFMLQESRLEKLAELISKRNIRMAWSALSRVDTVNEKKLKLAKSCGCWQILYGIESGAQKILDFYEKNVTVDQIKKAIVLTKKQGLYAKGFFIWGNPTETKETLAQTRDLIFTTPLDDISLTFFTPYPGAEIWDKVSQYGEFENDWDKLSCFDMVFVPNGMTKEEIIDSQMQTMKEFYKQPRVIWSYITRLRSWGQMKEFYKSIKVLSSYAK